MSADEQTGAAEDTGATEELVAVAQVVKVRGLRGEVVAELLTDFPERFEGLERLISVRPDGQRETLELDGYWFQARRIILKFAGFDSIEESGKLIGCELTVPERERVRLPEDEFYDWELAGCRVETIEGEHIGQVREVLHTGANDVLVIEGTKREHLIPLAEEICTEIDITGKLIRIDAPEGLLEF